MPQILMITCIKVTMTHLLITTYLFFFKLWRLKVITTPCSTTYSEGCPEPHFALLWKDEATSSQLMATEIHHTMCHWVWPRKQLCFTSSNYCQNAISNQTKQQGTDTHTHWKAITLDQVNPKNIHNIIKVKLV